MGATTTIESTTTESSHALSMKVKNHILYFISILGNYEASVFKENESGHFDIIDDHETGQVSSNQQTAVNSSEQTIRECANTYTLFLLLHKNIKCIIYLETWQYLIFEKVKSIW